MMIEKKHWKVIDALYAIGIILVIIGHSHSSDWSKFNGTLLDWGISYIYTFHMALFFFISGFLFSNSRSLERDGFIGWILNKAERLLIPYVFWSGFALIPKYYVEHDGFGGLTGAYLLRVLINPRMGVWGHFWFLPVMFLTYMVFGSVRQFVNAYNYKRFAAGMTLAAMFVYFLPINTEVLGLSDLRQMMPYFAFGMLVCEFLRELPLTGLRKYRGVYCLIAISTSVILKDRAYSNRPIGLLVATTMIIVCWIIGELVQDSAAISWLSGHNLTYYIFSWFFQAVAMALCDRLNEGWISTFLIMLIAGLSGPTIVLIVYERLHVFQRNFIKLILGVRE